jgi:hypothetical protein
MAHFLALAGYALYQKYGNDTKPNGYEFFEKPDNEKESGYNKRHGYFSNTDGFIPYDSFDFLANNNEDRTVEGEEFKFSNKLIGTVDSNGKQSVENGRNYNLINYQILCNKLLSYSKHRHNDGRWNQGINHCQDFADHAHHDCAPSEMAILNGESKDTQTVNALGDVKIDVGRLDITSSKFKDNYFNCRHVLNHTSTVANKHRYYVNLRQDIERKFPFIIARYDAEIKILQDVFNDATQNNIILNNNSKTLDTNLQLNNDYTNYLKERINIPKTVSINNYEELYKGVILQNDILQNSIDDIDNKVLSDDKKTNFITKKRSFVNSIYLKLFLFYYILVIIFIIFLIFIERNLKYYNKILLGILALLFPPIMFYIETILYNIWLYIISFLSSSVYTYTDISQ